MYNFISTVGCGYIFLKICIVLGEIHREKNKTKKLQNCPKIYVSSFYSMVLITDVHTGFTLQLPQLTNLPLSISLS